MRFLPIFLSLILLVTTVGAEPSRVRILLLPVQIHWGDQKLSPRTFFEVLEEEVEYKAPRANLVIPKEDDPRLKGVDLSRRPTAQELVALARTFHAALAVSLDIHGQRKIEDRPLGPLLNVGALARITIVENASGQVLLDEPVAVSHSDHCAGQAGSAEFEEQATSLTIETARDLAGLIVARSQKARAELTENARP